MEKTTRKSRAKNNRRELGGRHESNFLVQGTILGVAGIVVRLIGMLYRIPLVNKIGDEGNGYYTTAYSIYSILLIMSSYSLPVSVSKMVAARLARKQYRNSIRIFWAALFYATVVGGAGAAALWFGADFFAGTLFAMPYSAYAIRALAPTIWIMAYLGVLRGYFQGLSTMVPTAISQIFEQIINAVVSILAGSILFDVGMKSNLVYGSSQYSFAFGAAGGAIGTGAGALAALIFFLFLMSGYQKTMRKNLRSDQTLRLERYGTISRILFLTVVPIVFSSLIYNISTVVDNAVFAKTMTKLGEGSRVAKDWGVWGKYHLLFGIPVAIANSLSSSLIPSLSVAVAEKNRKQIIAKISSAIRLSMIIAIPSAVGMTVLAAPISNLLFPGVNSAMLAKMTMAGSAAVVFFSLSTVTNAVLQGINRMRIPVRNAAVSLVIHVVILYGMLYGMRLGVYSVVYANILFALGVCVLNGLAIGRHLRYRQEMKKTFLIPLIASGMMGVVAYGVYQLLYRLTDGILKGRAEIAICITPAILAAMLVYFVLLIKLRGVDEKDMRGMPGGTRLLAAARAIHLVK